MANLSLYFGNNINISAQVGDTAYYSPISSKAEFNVADNNVKMGRILSISKVANDASEYAGDWKIICSIPPGVEYPNVTSDFVFFTKDNVVNSAQALGYYSEVKFINNSNENFELYAVAFEAIESSK